MISLNFIIACKIVQPMCNVQIIFPTFVYILYNMINSLSSLTNKHNYVITMITNIYDHIIAFSHCEGGGGVIKFGIGPNNAFCTPTHVYIRGDRRNSSWVGVSEVRLTDSALTHHTPK